MGVTQPNFKILFYSLFEKLVSDINISVYLIKPSTTREFNFVPRISYGIIPSRSKKINKRFQIGRTFSKFLKFKS